MKKMKANDFFSGFVPNDTLDFGRCIDLLNKHPEWIKRLSEMKQLKRKNWDRLIAYWDKFTVLYNDLPHIKNPNISYKDSYKIDPYKYDYFDNLIQGIQVDNGILKTYKIPDSINHVLIEHLVIGSLVLQERNQEDEYDLYPSFICDIFPDISCALYDSDGKCNGSKIARGLKPQIECEIIKDTSKPIKNKLIKKIYDKMENYILKDPKTWRTCSFHYCPHYKLFDNLILADNESTTYEMFVADIYPLDPNINTEWKLGMCLISISKNHVLHPSNKLKDVLEIEYNGVKWVVSADPFKLYTYYEDGLINCFSSDVEETISSEDSEKIININISNNTNHLIV